MEETLMEERKQMLLTLMKDPTYVPMKLKELAMLLGVPKEQRKDLEEVLNELVASGKVGISKKGKYARSEVFAQTGIFSAHMGRKCCEVDLTDVDLVVRLTVFRKL